VAFVDDVTGIGVAVGFGWLVVYLGWAAGAVALVADVLALAAVGGFLLSPVRPWSSPAHMTR
jgi:hypothetical protein